MLSDMTSESKLLDPTNISCENGVKLSLSVRVLNSSTVNGVPCDWCRCCAWPTASS